MGLGFEVYDAGGVLLVSVNDSLTRVVGTISLPAGGASGSAAVDLSAGRPFAAFLPNGSGSRFNPPAIGATSTSITWTYDASGQGTTSGGTIIYGVY